MISDKVKDLVGSAIITSGRRLSRLEISGMRTELQEKLDAAPALSDSELTRMCLEIISSLHPKKDEKGAVDYLGHAIEKSQLHERLIELSHLISVPDKTEQARAQHELRELLKRNQKIL
jgi:hypothetical protein